jgi:hypothetical protein
MISSDVVNKAVNKKEQLEKRADRGGEKQNTFCNA